MSDKDGRAVLVCTIGSAGDVHPFIAVGQELRRRGHRVVLCTSGYFEPHARGAGLEFVGLGTPEDYLSVIEDPRLWEPETGFRTFADKVVLPVMEPVFRAIEGFDPQRTTIVAQAQVFGAHVAHEKYGFPFLTVSLQPAAFRSAHDFPLLPAWMPSALKRLLFAAVDGFVLDPVLAPTINRFRAAQGLRPVRHVLGEWMHSPQATLGLFPEWFAAPQPDWPRQTRLTGFVLHDGRGEEEGLPREVRSFLDSGDPPIAFTPGTAMKHGGSFLSTAIEVCQILGRRGMLLTPHTDQVPPALPDGIRHFAYVPFSLVLPRVAALVHHGGIGTTAQALAAGIPQVIRPMTHDQPDNAVRVASIGAGVTIRPRDFTARRASEQLDRLLSSPSIIARCKDIARRIDPALSLRETCDAVEGIAGPA